MARGKCEFDFFFNQRDFNSHTSIFVEEQEREKWEEAEDRGKDGD